MPYQIIYIMSSFMDDRLVFKHREKNHFYLLLFIGAD
jgi:hypothetical protein